MDLNQYCCDCLVQSVNYISVNNGIFLCRECATAHQSLSPTISFIKNLNHSNLDKIQLKILKNGGNSKFIKFMKLYGFENN